MVVIAVVGLLSAIYFLFDLKLSSIVSFLVLVLIFVTIDWVRTDSEPPSGH